MRMSNRIQVSIENIGSVKTGPFGAQLHQSDYVKSSGTPIVTVEHLSERGLNHKNLPLVSDADKNRLKQYVLSTNDIVFSRVGSVDRCSIVSEKENGWLFSGRLLRIRPQKDQVYSPYLVLLFQTEKFKHYMRSIAVGGTMPSLNTQILSKVKICLPPLPEQKAIADILQTWDTAIEKTEDLIAAKEKRFDWLISEQLRGVTKNTNSKNILGNICKIKTGKKDVNEGNAKGKYPFFTCAKNHTYSDSYSFDMEAILIAGNGYIGNPVLYRGKFEAYQRTYILHNFLETDAEYLNYLLKRSLQKKIAQEKQEGAMSYIKLRTLQSIEIALPPLPEQKRIAETLNTARQEIDTLKSLADQYRTQKRGLMQKLLTGKWRVKV